jgi:hypothetical protein
MLLAVAAALTACAYEKPNPTPPYAMGPTSPGDPTTSRVGGKYSGTFFIGGANCPGFCGDGGAIAIDVFLWRGALDTLDSLPLASADPFGGVIVTDWYTPAGASGERLKTTVFIVGHDLRGEDLRVGVFRQVDQGGRWVDAPVSPLAAADIETKVLDRARILRAQATGKG